MHRNVFSLLVASLLFVTAGVPGVCAQATDGAAPVASPGVPPTVFENPVLVKRYQQTITPEDLASHLYFFASDFFEGRATTARGQKLAAHYLASQYRKMGVAPRGTVETSDPYAPEAYFQPFTVYSQRLKLATLEVLVDGETAAANTFSSTRQDPDAYLTYGNMPEVEGQVVFAGYGIADPALGYDDYAALRAAGVETAGHWVLILRDEPLEDAETSRLPTHDGAPSVWSQSIYQKIRAARSTGGMPKGYLVVGDVGPRTEAPVAEVARRKALALEEVGSLSLSEVGMTPRPPFYTISSALADAILAPTGRTVADLQREIDAELKPVVFEVPGNVSVRSRIEAGTEPLTTENVVAFIEGSDPELKDEVVIISSHYDHVGIDPSREGDQIFNGADDDGSGTVATLEVAEAFARARRDGYGPRRSVLFLNVSGEEKGLLGSEHFADVEPVVPLDRIVTNLNIDMIGRHDPTHEGEENYIYIIGSNLISQELHDINVKVNDVTEVGLELSERFNSKDDPNQFYARSDHWNFGKHGVPFIFFFNGTHEDYHGVDDEPDRIDYARMADVARLIFGTAWQVANQEARPAVSGTGFN